MNAGEIAAKAAELIGGDRERVHGEKRRSFGNIATLWNAWLAIRREPAAPLTDRDVAVMMSLFKFSRMESGEYNPDDGVDAPGYAAIAGEFDGPPADK